MMAQLSGGLSMSSIRAKSRSTASIVVGTRVLRTTSAQWCAMKAAASNAPTPAANNPVQLLVLPVKSLASGKSSALSQTFVKSH
jgi:hypothetical protein